MHVHLVSNLFVDDILAIEHTVETMKDGSFVVWVIDIHFSNKVVTCFLRKGDMPGSESPSDCRLKKSIKQLYYLQPAGGRTFTLSFPMI